MAFYSFPYAKTGILRVTALLPSEKKKSDLHEWPQIWQSETLWVLLKVFILLKLS